MRNNKEYCAYVTINYRYMGWDINEENKVQISH